MTSKNYLHKSMKGNLRRNLWLMILFLLTFFAAGPANILVSLDAAKHTAAPYPYGFTQTEYIQWTFRRTVGLSNSLTVLLIVVCAGLAAFAGFFYLYSQEKTDFYHSLPLKREKLFGIQYISGLLAFLIPYLLNKVIALGVGAVYGAVNLEALKAIGMESLFAAVFFLAIYGVGILAVLLTGNLFAGLLGFAALLAYGPVLYLAYREMNQRFFDTLAFDSGHGEFFSPVTVYIQAASSWELGNSVGIYLLYGAVLSVVLLAVNILVYRIRPSESFHRAIAFQKLEPVIKVCGLPPLILLSAMFFSGQMYQGFFWMVIAALVLTLIFSAVYDFICTMDIRAALKPRVSTGVILAGLVVILGGYRMDITGVDSFLPEKSKIASMSVYLNSISGQFGYPEAADTNDPLSFLKENRIENFQDIYDLAKQGVEYSQNNEREDNQTVWVDSWGMEETQVSVYIGYHMKSGRDVYRLYYLPETEELVENVGRIYNCWEYREKVLPTSYIEPEKIESIYTFGFSEQGKKLSLSGDSLDTLLKTYKGELENLTFARGQEERVIGYMEFQERTKAATDYYLPEGYLYSYNLPVYESFEKTRNFLEKLGNPMPSELSPEEISSVELSRYEIEEDTGMEKDLRKVFSDEEDIEAILKRLTYAEGRFTIGSSLEYSLNVQVTWKEQEKGSYSFYLLKDDSLTELMGQLEEQNID